MKIEAELRRQIAHGIATAPSLAKSFEAYYQCWFALPEYKFVFGSANGAGLGFAVNRRFTPNGIEGGPAVRSLFKTDHVTVLDPDTAREMTSGTSTYPVDFSISLDTNAMSYLAPHMNGRKTLPPGVTEVFDFIARPDVWVDPIPYIVENMGNGGLQDPKRAARVFETLRAYETLKTIDLVSLHASGEIRSTLGDAELIKATQETIAGLFYDLTDSPAMRGLKLKYDISHAFLLKTVLTQLRRKTWSPDRKMEEFVEFSHDRMATMSARDLTLARAYFERGQGGLDGQVGLKFFAKIQAKKNDLVPLVRNMAWDLFHLRYLEAAMLTRPRVHARYLFPALLTFDQGLIEVMDICALRSIAFTSDEADTMPVYETDISTVLALDPIRRDELLKRYCCAAAAEDRTRRRGAMKALLPSLVAELENELLEFGLARA